MSTTDPTASDEGSQYFEQSVEVSLLPSEHSVVDDENKHDQENPAPAPALHTAAVEPPKSKLRKRKPAKPVAAAAAEEDMQGQGYDYCAPPHMHDGLAMQQQPAPVFVRMPSQMSEDDKCCRWKWVSRGGVAMLVTCALVFFALGVALLARTQEDVVTSTDTMGAYSKDLGVRRQKYITAMDGMVELIGAATGKADELGEGSSNTTFADQLRSARTEFVGIIEESKTIAEAVARVSSMLKDSDLDTAISNAADALAIFHSIMKSVADTGRLRIEIVLDKHKS